MTVEISHGHFLFRVLQEGKYFAAVRDAVAYDYWDELPEERRAQYERAALELMKRGQIDRNAVTLAPPPPKIS